ncbi:MAG: ABC transporter permease [Eubacteriales bacterium]|nr:ABC transporter permease [Eubacteriales bacterium]
MKFGDLLNLAVSNLKRRKLRTFLTVLGVIIGTASIIVMVSLGIGQSELQMELISSSTSLTTISVYGGSSGYMYSMGGGSSASSGDEPLYITDETIEQFKNLPYATGASPILNYYVIAKQGVYESSFNLAGVSHDYLEQIPLSEGKVPEKGSSQLSLIYGNMIRRDFTNSKTNEGYWDTGEEPDVDLINKPMFIIFDRDKYYQSQSNNQDSGSGDDGAQPVTPPKKYIVPTAGIVKGGPMDWNQYSYNVYCDVDALKTQLKTIFRKNPIPGQPTNKKGKPYNYFIYDEAEVYADDMEHVMEIQNRITEMGFQANSNVEWVQSSQKQMQAQQAVLGGIGAVSLLVAAIGIANTMMMSIYERTKEIGVMKVLGCDMNNIRDMFLLESGFIGLMGGIAGIAVSYAISKIINVLYLKQQMEQAAMGGYDMSATGDISRIPPWLILLALIFAILIGMLAGFFPAKRAMKLSALSAIRNE